MSLELIQKLSFSIYLSVIPAGACPRYQKDLTDSRLRGNDRGDESIRETNGGGNDREDECIKRIDGGGNDRGNGELFNMPNKFLGQHFLQNAHVKEKIIAAIDAQKNETIIEVGPGHGELTRPLAEVCLTKGAHLVAIEKDRKLAHELGTMIHEPRIEIIHGDVLKVLGSWSSVRSSFKIVGNIPYYLTGHLLRIISELNHRPLQCVFMVQKEVAKRMSAGIGEMNRLAASLQYWADVKILIAVSKEDFSPPPKVDSAVVVLNRKPRPASADAERYFAALRALFAQPRKTILNNLASRELRVVNSGGKLNKELIADNLGKLGISPNSRPEGLSIEQIAKITEMFFEE
jgi:16S rRNA (adenine1518-N6/adenine1519-N6)-dimethyltransferase